MRYLALALALFPTLASAQPVTNPAPVGGAGAYNSAPPTCTAGQFCFLQTDSAGNLKTVSSGSPTGVQQVEGNVASAAADSGNPVKVGGVYNSTLPTFATGQRGDFQIGTRGSQNVTIFSADSATSAAVGTNSSDGISGAGAGLNTRSVNYNFNGTNLDRQFTCANSAVVNVTAGSTTELVSLTASQVIRVCSFAITMSAAGTAQFVYGTGTNCGSGTTSLTGAMTLGTTTPMALSAANGSLFRGATANALCLAAVTGNVTGFISYAKF